MSNKEKTEIRVKINGGTLIAVASDNDAEYPGISVLFVSEAGDLFDVVGVEGRLDERKIHTYTYEDEYSEDVTDKYVLDIDKMLESIED